MITTIPESELILNPDGSIYHLGLLPEEIADTIITVGDPDRVEKISRLFDRVELKKAKRELVTHTGELNGKRLTVLSTGMGTDNIDIVMNELDALVNIDFQTRTIKETISSLNIVRVGTSGSLREEIPVGSLLCSTRAVGLDTLGAYYNIKMSADESETAQYLQKHLDLPFQPYCVEGSGLLAERIGFDMIKGTTATFPGFYAPQGRKLRYDLRIENLPEKLNSFYSNGIVLANAEMETAGIYLFGRLHGHHVLSLNAILANRMTGEFSADPGEVVEGLIEKILERV